MGEWIESSVSYKRTQRLKRQKARIAKNYLDKIHFPENKESLSNLGRPLKNERNLKGYLKKHWKKLFPQFKLIDFEYGLHGIKTAEYLGLIDIVMKRGKTHYVVEIKHSPANGISNFWDALKVIGYATAYRLEHAVRTIPLVMLDKKYLNIDTLLILSVLKIGYITFFTNDKYEYEFEYCLP